MNDDKRKEDKGNKKNKRDAVTNTLNTQVYQIRMRLCFVKS